MKTIIFINNLLQNVGIQIKKYPSYDVRRRFTLIKSHRINKILDIGANTGIFGKEMREFGYGGEIISFEPLTKAYIELLKNSGKDHSWQALNYAIGNFDGETSINISKNSVSSSIMEMLPLHYENENDSKFINSETIKVCKLDTVFDSFYNSGDKVFVKVDTQGYEKNVLDGAKQCIHKIEGLQLELSSVPLYKGSPHYAEMIEFIDSLGFSLYSIENGFCDDKSGRLLQFDAIFFREQK
jgi:FkbM family methyltransferase